MAGYNPANTYSTGQTGAFPGTTPGQAPTGLSTKWANVNVLLEAPKTGVRTRTTPDGVQPVGGGAPVLMNNPSQTLGQLLTDFDLGQGPFGDKARIEQLQQALWQGNFYGNHKVITFTPGERDNATRVAFEKAAKEAAREQTVLGDFIDTRATARSAAGLGAAGSTAQPLRATNPADLDALALQVADKAWGRGLSDSELAKVRGALQALEQPYLAAKGSVAPPGAAAFQQAAEQTLRKIGPTEAGAHDVLNVIGSLTDMIGGTSNG